MSSGKCVHEWVREQARKTPGAIALGAGNEMLTYAELERRAVQLASYLRRMGVGTEVPVALFLPRSADLVVAALGVLIAGGAYIPLDPSYPARRISLMLKDSAVQLVISQPGLGGMIPSGAWKTVALDRDLLDGYVDFSAPASNPDQLAYIIFTSGSTGRPKGVQVTHANLMNLIIWHQRQFAVTSSDRATLHASPGFDASVWELWPYLAAGASVWAVDDSVRTNPEELRDWLIRTRISVTFLPTALAEAMIDLPWPSQAPLRFVLTGADTLKRRPVDNLPFALVNNYGPTECTVVATSGTVQSSGSGRPSIGRPIDGIVIQIVNEELHPVATGEAGELLIGGAGLARGYLNAPELTADKFVTATLGARSQRFYRTGDLGRYLPSGDIEFLGRLDEQVKVMGHRVEPAEIIAVLNRHPGIKESFVTGHLDPSGTVRLVAYVVPAAAKEISLWQIRDHLSSHLPGYMVPSTFVRLGEIPLSAHGKVDRSALPPPSPDNVLSDESFAAPQSPVEVQIAQLVSALIRVEPVGRDDNFFTLGGHSLMGAQLIAKIREIFAVDLTLRSLFDAPTVAAISAEIERLIYAKVAAMSEGEARSILDSTSKVA